MPWHTLDGKLEILNHQDHPPLARGSEKRTKTVLSPDGIVCQLTLAMQQPSALSSDRLVLYFRLALYFCGCRAAYLVVLVALSSGESQLRTLPHQYCWTVPHTSF